jgi:hypothetical protein
LHIHREEHPGTGKHRCGGRQGTVRGRGGHCGDDISSSIEAKLRERGGSTAPADAAGKVLGVQPRDQERQARFSNIVHWSYGSTWGAMRGLLHAAGIDGNTAIAMHFAAVWGSSQVMLPSLDVAPPPWQTPPQELAIDALHHAVYAAATGIAFAALERTSA